MAEPKVSVGIMSEPKVKFCLHGDFIIEGVGPVSGEHSATAVGDQVQVDDMAPSTCVIFKSQSPKDEIELIDVTIGVNFHWERKENQRFKGDLKLIVEDGKVTTINVLPVEDYLCSVISSEMSATASLELLKAHAVISRSWLLAQIEKGKGIACSTTETYPNPEVDTPEELIKWWDREDHFNFDVCADDHCQRYQGVTRQTTPTVEEAIAATRGEVLMSGDGQLCDARFSKCCGGVFEKFSSCWEPIEHSYLQARRDSAEPNRFPDLTIERNAEEWILSTPSAFCDTHSPEILGQVLNNYDQETTDFYRWRVEYTREELAVLVKERTGIDYGDIVDLVPVARGTSGRLYKLEIVGTKRSRIIGKELEIRRSLSKSHLYSSAFVVERADIGADGVPGRIILHGAGWGHGVGLCQIGAAVMGAKGYDYRHILTHYFQGVDINKLY